MWLISLALQAMEQDDLIHAVEEFRPERRAHHAHHLITHRVGVLPFRLVHQEVRAEVRCHRDQRVAEVDRVALPVGEAPVVEHLQQHVEHIRVRLLDLVEQDHLVGPTTHGFGERAALLVADVARRRADQPRNRVLLHVLRHVDADERGFVVEQVFGERFGQLGLADAGGAEEHERADRPVRILQAGACAAHRGRNGSNRFGLADDALADHLLHAQELFLLAFEHPVDRHTGPARDDLRDVIGGDGLLDHRAFAVAFGRGKLLLQVRNRVVGELAGALVVALALGVVEFDTRALKVSLELRGIGELALLRLPARRQIGRALLQRGQFFFEHSSAAPSSQRRSPS